MNPNHFPAYFGDVPSHKCRILSIIKQSSQTEFTNLDITVRLRLGDGIIYTIAIQFLDGTSAEPQKSLRRKRSTSASMSKHWPTWRCLKIENSKIPWESSIFLGNRSVGQLRVIMLFNTSLNNSCQSPSKPWKVKNFPNKCASLNLMLFMLCVIFHRKFPHLKRTFSRLRLQCTLYHMMYRLGSNLQVHELLNRYTKLVAARLLFQTEQVSCWKDCETAAMHVALCHSERCDSLKFAQHS